MIKIIPFQDYSDFENPKTLYRKYDTNAAKLIESYIYETGTDKELIEDLYRTQKGEWFLAGTGGIDSKYAKGENITVLTEAEALQWLVDHAPASSTIADYFADRIVDA